MPGQDVDPWAIEPWDGAEGPSTGADTLEPSGVVASLASSAPGIVAAETHGWPAVIDAVLLRDRRCIFADMGPIVRLGASVLRSPFTDHFCRTPFGAPIPWWRDRLAIRERHARHEVELDHVKEADKLAMSMKAPDDEAHLVVVCHGAHHGGLATSKEGRAFSRAWLSALYPDVWNRPAGPGSRR